MPGRRVVRHHPVAGVTVEVDVPDDAVATWADAGQGAGVVDQGEAGELRNCPTAQSAAALEQPRHVGESAFLLQSEQRPGVRAVPQQPEHPGGAALEEVVANHSVEIGQGCLVHARDPRERRHDVDESAVTGHHAASEDTRPGQQQGRTGLHHVERAVLTEVAAAFGEVVGRGMDDRQVGAAGVGEERGQPGPGQRVVVAVRGRRGLGGFGSVARERRRVRPGPWPNSTQHAPLGVGCGQQQMTATVRHVHRPRSAPVVPGVIRPGDEVHDRCQVLSGQRVNRRPQRRFAILAHSPILPRGPHRGRSPHDGADPGVVQSGTFTRPRGPGAR